MRAPVSPRQPLYSQILMFVRQVFEISLSVLFLSLFWLLCETRSISAYLRLVLGLRELSGGFFKFFYDIKTSVFQHIKILGGLPGCPFLFFLTTLRKSLMVEIIFAPVLFLCFYTTQHNIVTQRCYSGLW